MSEYWKKRCRQAEKAWDIAYRDFVRVSAERDALMPILETIHRCINESGDYFIREVVKASMAADEICRQLEEKQND
jgi:hypothetical protein